MQWRERGRADGRTDGRTIQEILSRNAEFFSINGNGGTRGGGGGDSHSELGGVCAAVALRASLCLLALPGKWEPPSPLTPLAD